MGNPIPLVAQPTPGSTPSGAIPVAVYGLPDTTLIAALTPVSAADASDLDTAQALANANKAAINAIIAALKG